MDIFRAKNTPDNKKTSNTKKSGRKRTKEKHTEPVAADIKKWPHGGRSQSVA